MKTKKELWGEKSKTFPVYNENDVEDIKFIEKIIAEACGGGAYIKGKSIIDIGCGTGRHTFNLAKSAAEVHGIDISEDMIGVLNETAKKYGFKNVTSAVCDWKEADIEARGWFKKFDIAWAAMTGAINSEDDILKMNLCARERAVCVAWGRWRENAVMSEIFAAHGAELKLPAGAGEIQKALKRMNINYKIDYLENGWSVEGTREEAAADIAWHLKMSEIAPDGERIYSIIDKYHNNGIYGHSTRMETAVISWKVKSI